MEKDKIVISEKAIYKNKIDLKICKDPQNYITNNRDKYTHNTWNCDVNTSFNLTDNILNIEELRLLKLHILFHIDRYMGQNKQFFDGYIYNSWINVYKKNFYQELHVHTDPIHNFLSGVVYLTKNNSEVEFNLQNRINVKPEFGQILIFEDDIEHRVLPNKEDLRISLAFNFVKKSKWQLYNGN